MPQITSSGLSDGNTVSAEDIYEKGTTKGGLFDPSNDPATGTDNTLELLNGGLTEANYDYDSGNNPLPAYAFVPGSFAGGLTLSFDEWNWVYAKTMGYDANNGSIENQRAGLTCSKEFFLPWDASIVLYYFAFFARADATEWDVDGGGIGRVAEYWHVRTLLDGSAVTALEGKLPHGRSSQDDPDAATLHDDPGVHAENRWRYFQRWSASTSLSRGKHIVRVSTWPFVKGPDQKTAKLLYPTACMSILALR